MISLVASRSPCRHFAKLPRNTPVQVTSITTAIAQTHSFWIGRPCALISRPSRRINLAFIDQTVIAPKSFATWLTMFSTCSHWPTADCTPGRRHRRSCMPRPLRQAAPCFDLTRLILAPWPARYSPNGTTRPCPAAVMMNHAVPLTCNTWHSSKPVEFVDASMHESKEYENNPTRFGIVLRSIAPCLYRSGCAGLAREWLKLRCPYPIIKFQLLMRLSCSLLRLPVAGHSFSFELAA